MFFDIKKNHAIARGLVEVFRSTFNNKLKSFLLSLWSASDRVLVLESELKLFLLDSITSPMARSRMTNKSYRHSGAQAIESLTITHHPESVERFKEKNT